MSLFLMVVREDNEFCTTNCERHLKKEFPVGFDEQGDVCHLSPESNNSQFIELKPTFAWMYGISAEVTKVGHGAILSDSLFTEW